MCKISFWHSKVNFPNYSSTSVQISEKHNIIRSFITLPLDYGVFISLYIFSFKPDWFTLVYNIWGIIFIIFSVMLLIKSWNDLIKNELLRI